MAFLTTHKKEDKLKDKVAFLVIGIQLPTENASLCWTHSLLKTPSPLPRLQLGCSEYSMVGCYFSSCGSEAERWEGIGKLHEIRLRHRGLLDHNICIGEQLGDSER